VGIANIDLTTLEIDSIGSWSRLLRFTVIGATCFLILVLGYYFQFSDLIDQLNNLSTKMVAAKDNFIDTQQKVANLDVYKKEVKIVEEQLDILTEQLPQRQEEAGLLEDISQQAIRSSVQFINIKPSGQVNKGFYQEIPMILTLSGEYNGFGEFVSHISNMSRIVTLHDFTIKRNNTNGTGSLMMTVEAKTYWASGGH
jgi:type IV pilus assembly protein PilO